MDLRSRLLPVTIATGALLLVAACGNGPPAENGVTVRDSAGVTIVESPAALEELPLGWVVAESAHVSIGVVEGEEPYQLFAVGGAARLGDGRIAVVNSGTQEVRYFDGEGRFLSSSGRRGGGPGEYQFPRLVPPLGGSGELLIWDARDRRFTLLDGEGSVLSTATPDRLSGGPVGWDGDSMVLSRENSASAGPSSPEGIMENRATFQVIRLGGGDPVTLAEVPGRLYHARIGRQIWFRLIPYDAWPSAAAGPSAFFITSGAEPEVRVHGSGGELLRVLRVLREPTPVTPADVERFVERELESFDDAAMRAEWRDHYARMPAATSAPVYQSGRPGERALHLDATGHLWAERFQLDPDESATWSVFHPDGRALGTVRTPAGLTVYQIGEDFVLGRTRDELEIERVVLHRLERSGAGR
ncbi:MAG TPA: hypothetical protein VMK65_13705 [Longimicrobiales bacterium]|nr:hypothetical protein [Longimicrobiales bacterium]